MHNLKHNNTQEDFRSIEAVSTPKSFRVWKEAPAMRYILALCLMIASLSAHAQQDDDLLNQLLNQQGRSEPGIVTPSDPSSSRAAAEWTFLVYLAADNNLDKYALEDIQEMEQVGSSDRLNIVVFTDRGEGWKSARRGLVLRRPEEGVQSLDPSVPTCEELGEVDSGDPATLQNFVQWGLQKYPANRVALVLWNHGGGWRDLGSTYFRSLDSSTFTPGGSTTPAVSTRAICSDDTSNSIIYMKDVRTVLERAGRRFDLIACDACLMGMIEVAYELKDLTPLYIGSEQLIPGAGYNYTPFLQALSANPGMSTQDFGARIIQAYGENYASEADATLSMVDTTTLKDLVASLNQFVQQSRDAASRAENKANPYLPARENAGPPMGDPKQPDPFYDLGRFLEFVSSNNQFSPGVVSAAQNALSVYRRVVLSNVATMTSKRSGLAIFFPENASATDYAAYTANNIRFAQDCAWPQFLQTYIAGGGGGGGGGMPPISGPIGQGSGRSALIVGVGKYASGQSLPSPVNDAKAFADILQSGFGFAPSQITVVLNEQATKARMRDELIRLSNAASPNGLAVFAFFGQGTQARDLDGDESDRKDEALVPFDVMPGRIDSLLVDDELRGVIDLNPYTTWSIFLGSSHSGSSSRSLDFDGGTPPDQLFQVFDPTLAEDMPPEPAPAAEQSGTRAIGDDPLSALLGESAPPASDNSGSVAETEQAAPMGRDIFEKFAGDNNRVAVFAACKSYQTAWGFDLSAFMMHFRNGLSEGRIIPGRSTYGDVAAFFNRRLSLMRFNGQPMLVTGVPPFGAVMISIGGQPLRQDPDVEVPINMKRLPFLGFFGRDDGRTTDQTLPANPVAPAQPQAPPDGRSSEQGTLEELFKTP